MDRFVTKDPNQLTVTIWYSVSKTVEVMAKFQALEFKSHVAISNDYIKFMVQNVPSSNASSFNSKVKDLEMAITTNKQIADLALKASSVASIKANNVGEMVEVVTKRMATLEACA